MPAAAASAWASFAARRPSFFTTILRTSLLLRQSCFDVWHSRPRLCELPYTAEGGCATSDRYFMHQTMLDGALLHYRTRSRKSPWSLLRLPRRFLSSGRRGYERERLRSGTRPGSRRTGNVGERARTTASLNWRTPGRLGRWTTRLPRYSTWTVCWSTRTTHISAVGWKWPRRRGFSFRRRSSLPPSAAPAVRSSPIFGAKTATTTPG